RVRHAEPAAVRRSARQGLQAPPRPDPRPDPSGHARPRDRLSVAATGPEAVTDLRQGSADGHVSEAQERRGRRDRLAADGNHPRRLLHAVRTMSEVAEVLQTIDRLNAALADLMVRGLRSAGQAQLGPLDALREELERIGAAHLAGRITALLDAIR